MVANLLFVLIVGVGIGVALILAARELRWQYRRRHGVDSAFHRDDALRVMQRWDERGDQR